jgi:transcriptional regulator with XRE-family HTH domain
MTKETNTIGARIRECRKALGLSQEALAEALETTPDYLLLGKTEEELWMKDVIRVLGGIQDPAMRKLALDQLKCIASVYKICNDSSSEENLEEKQTNSAILHIMVQVWLI